MPFSVGQIVQVDCTGFGPHARLQSGDRGTVIAAGERLSVAPIVLYKILWHKDQVVSDMVEDALKLYTHPVDAPGRASGAFGTMDALRVVLQEEQQHAMADVLLQLERSRMQAEDFRSGNGPAFLTSPGRVETLSWRARARGLQQECLDGAEVIDEARLVIGLSRNALDAFFANGDRANVSAARRRMNDHIRILNEFLDDGDDDEDCGLELDRTLTGR